MIRVLLADDHPLFREGVASLLKRTPDIELVGAAATGEDALRLAHELRPDVVLMDLAMPGGGGIEATRRIAHELPQAGVLVLTMYEDDESVFAAVQAGARGYVLKDGEPDGLLRAIRAVAYGEALFGAAVARRVLQQSAPMVRDACATGDDAPPSAQLAPELTPREIDVVRLVAQGMTNRHIAEALVIAEGTAEKHVGNILAKLDLASRAQLAVWAVERGLVDRSRAR
jgi:DNA-binding NarL/FixJ family response regulator